MVKRYLPSRRSSNTSSNAVRDQFIKDLTKEAESLLKSYTQQFADALQSQSANALQSLFGDGSSGGGGGSANGLNGLFSAASALFKGSAKTTSTTAETDRSKEIESRFKVSQAQALAEASAAISKGDKNL